ncbi:hypothetical protein [Hansschlegelia sp. KR7-227]|uniref:hypothetical protein n=1 Tax=Hansschlegelia sp. KR7-227 TaxID=3400914 RepID=UPI003C0D4E02
MTVLGGAFTILAAVVAQRAASALKAIKDEKRASSLYRTIINVATMLVTTRLAQGGDSAVLTGVPAGIVNDVVDLVKRQNPESVKALGQTDAMLKTKVIAKLPEVQASVAEAAAKVQSAAQ